MKFVNFRLSTAFSLYFRIANQIDADVQVIYENEHICCILDIAPFNEGHVLILPKRHYHDLEEMDDITLKAIMDAAVLISKKIKLVFQPDGITICQNGGIFNDLTHFHMHVIPRYKNDGFRWSDPVINHKAETRLSETREKLV
ncbi:HIT family protein [Paenibacillus lemnae]|uniref:HIT family protein n=1 Tax=Paenibacillus lemnae TaxID=1330551 RepID=A0A848MAS0_PAELE|nr:HIT family protein [Paenibacillus lemnae]NMO98187.1 HIT family protein [Paenibacillus lemnae]